MRIIRIRVALLSAGGECQCGHFGDDVAQAHTGSYTCVYNAAKYNIADCIFN